MGATHVTVTIRNPADPSRRRDGLFPVDTSPARCSAAPVGVAVEAPGAIPASGPP